MIELWIKEIQLKMVKDHIKLNLKITLFKALKLNCYQVLSLLLIK